MLALPPCHGVEHEWVDAAGLRVHVAIAGEKDAPPVVLLHGWPQHWWCWRGVIPWLAGTHRVYAIDLRGHGWTDAPPSGYEKEQLASDVLAALDALGVERFCLAGHDWGGWVAQLIALRAPERVQVLGLVNIAHLWTDPKASWRHLWRFLYQPLIATPGLGPAVQRSGIVTGRLPGLSRADSAVFAASFKEPARAQAGSLVYRTFLTREFREGVAGKFRGQRFQMPARMLFGKQDVAIHPDLVRDFPQHGVDATIEWVPDAGHFLPDERPELVADRLREWFTLS